jgi:hypothetical protein
MSDDNELEGGRPRDESVGDQAAPQPPDVALPVDGSESSYDVSGAALGALDPAEEAALYAAASVDSAVSAELAAMEAVSAELALLAPVTSMNRGRSAGIRSRLIARAAATHAGRPVPKVAIPDSEHHGTRSAMRPAASAPRRPHASASPGTGATGAARQPTGTHRVIQFERQQPAGLGRVIGGLALAAAVLIAAFGIYTWRSNTVARSTQPATTVGQDSSTAMQLTSLRASVAQKDSIIATLTGMHTRVIDLVSVSSADPMGRMFWDQNQHTFIMYASNLKPPPTGKTYQVWLIARGGAAPISAGTFMPDSYGSAVMTTRNPMEPGSLRRVAVTEEPNGGTVAPTGPVVFSGVGR